MKLGHVLRAQDFSRDWMDHFFRLAGEVKVSLNSPSGREQLSLRLLRKKVFAFFAEESTRTRFSFCTAAINLGMSVVWCENGRFSSMAKGESLEETVEVLLGFRPDVLVLRHPDDDASAIAAQISDRRHGGIPIINAGSGRKHHPTQALLDMFTIQEILGRLDNLTVAIGADVLYSRTARSIAYILSKFHGISMRFITPAALRPPSELLDHLWKSGVNLSMTSNLKEGIRGADVVYWGRLQVERVPDEALKAQLARQCAKFQIGMREISLMEPHAILLHPMPISDKNEIAMEVRQGPVPSFKAYEQAANGLPVRMALLLELFEGGN